MPSDILDKQEEELDRYQDMAKRLRESGDGSPRMLAYLPGAIVTSQHAMEMKESKPIHRMSDSTCPHCSMTVPNAT
jgi:hypothetical protein